MSLLASASERLRDVEGFPRRPGRPRRKSSQADDSAAPPVSRPGRSRSPVRNLEIAPAADSEPETRNRPVTGFALPARLLGMRDGGAYIGVSAWAMCPYELRVTH